MLRYDQRKSCFSCAHTEGGNSNTFRLFDEQYVRERFSWKKLSTIKLFLDGIEELLCLPTCIPPLFYIQQFGSSQSVSKTRFPVVNSRWPHWDPESRKQSSKSEIKNTFRGKYKRRWLCLTQVCFSMAWILVEIDFTKFSVKCIEILYLTENLVN